MDERDRESETPIVSERENGGVCDINTTPINAHVCIYSWLCSAMRQLRGADERGEMTKIPLRREGHTVCGART